jgi:SAM-dependent methyltransferase
MRLWSKLNWVSSLDTSNRDLLEDLRHKLEDYYRTNSEYYKDISDSEELWEEESYLPYQEILTRLKLSSGKVLEIGCGNASVLTYYPDLQKDYYGLDFSENLLESNSLAYPDANFVKIQDSNTLPFKDTTFQTIFSVFVLEHVIYPSSFLREVTRVLKPGGTLIILCPDFLGQSWMASQRVGLGPGTGRQKLNEGRILDAFLTGIDSRIRIPVYALMKKRLAALKPKFYINLDPVCFTDHFQPDVDAVYVTYEKEIKEFISTYIEWKENSAEMKSFCTDRRLLFLEGEKK